ncbi:hypothetical protein [Cloacibacillus evryensis]|uniref:hypothetical protein n=1 Tax=Cloacibacillus evryensis TaxID=508460 RepID=UPI0004B2BF84|nr:hypothetical protein [Cloacibacillus evryensis]
MPKKVSIVPKKVSQIEDVLCLFADYCPTGLACFFGDEEFSDTEELAAMALARYAPAEDVGPVDGGKGTPQQQIIVEAAENIKSVITVAGGLEAMQKVFMLFEAEMPSTARLIRDMNYIGRSFQYPSVEVFAYKHHITEKQFYRKRKKALREISWEIYRRGELSEKVSEIMS